MHYHVLHDASIPSVVTQESKYSKGFFSVDSFYITFENEYCDTVLCYMSDVVTVLYVAFSAISTILHLSHVNALSMQEQKNDPIFCSLQEILKVL